MDPYVGEIRLFTGNYAPMGWMFCDGQLLAIQQYSALYSIMGITYGGDGRSNFALPDLRGKASIHQGQGPGLTPRRLGEGGGEAIITLTESEMPSHNHIGNCQSVPNKFEATDAFWASAKNTKGSKPVYATGSPTTSMNLQSLQSTGGSQPHNNMQPYLGLNFIIAYEGVFPSRP